MILLSIDCVNFNFFTLELFFSSKMSFGLLRVLAHSFGQLVGHAESRVRVRNPQRLVRDTDVLAKGWSVRFEVVASEFTAWLHLILLGLIN